MSQSREPARLAWIFFIFSVFADLVASPALPELLVFSRELVPREADKVRAVTRKFFSSSRRDWLAAVECAFL